MEFRANFFLHAFFDSVWVLVQIGVLQVYFQYTNDISGWTKMEVFALVGAFRTIKGLFDPFLRPNLLSIPGRVNRGQFDYIFAWPVNSQFVVSCAKHLYSDLGSLVSGLAITIYALSNLNLIGNFYTWLTLGIGIICGTVIFYSIFFFFMTFSLFTVRLSATKSLYDILSNLFRWPTDILTFGNRFTEALIVPLAIVSTIPSKIFLGKIPGYYLVLEIFITMLIFALVNRFWQFAIRHYTSASS